MKRLIVAAVLAAFPAVAQDFGLPPDDQAMKALDAYPAVAAAEARLGAARANEDMLRAGPYEFTLSGAMARRDVEREGRYQEHDVTLTRPLRLPNKASLDRKAGRLGVEVARNQGEDVHHRTALLLSELWYDWLLAGELVRGDAAVIATQEAALKAMQRRVQERDAAALDLDQAQAALSLAQAQHADSRAKLEKARVTLAATFPDLVLAPEPPALPSPEMPAADIHVLRDLVIERSHEIRAAEGEAERMSVVARRAQADRVPDPTLGLRLFNERGGLEKGVGLSVSIPLGWSHRRAAAGKASAEASAASFDAATVRREILATADADLADVQTRFAAWASMHQSAVSTDTAAARTGRGQEMGAIDLADALYARRQASDARRAEVSARADALRAIVKLLIDSHTIWSDAHDHDADNAAERNAAAAR